MTNLPILDTTYPVLIFKAGRDFNHHGMLGIARSLGRLGVPVYAVVEDRYTPIAASRYLTKVFVWQSWPSDHEAFLTAMSSIGEFINRPTILIAVDDLSSIFVAENAIALSRWFLFPQLPWNLPRHLADKASFYSLCAKIGVPYPRSVVARSVDDVREFIKHTTFPIVVKAAEQWRLLNDRHNVKVVPTRDALFEFCEHTEFGSELPIVLQEFIPGVDWIYDGYCNPKIDLYVGFTGKKLLRYPPNAGTSAVGLSVCNEAVRCQSEELLGAISYAGIIDIDWRQDERNGRYKILDCNPRVGMNFRMFENSAAMDVVRALHLDLSGRSIERLQMIEGRIFIVEPWYLLSSIHGGRSASVMEAGRHLSSVSTELAWWSSDDKLPFLLMSARLLQRTIRRVLREIWKRTLGELMSYRKVQ